MTQPDVLPKAEHVSPGNLSATRDASPPRTLTVFDGVVFTAGVVIGIGIFRMPPLVAMNTPNELVFMLAWVAGGAAMLIGMLCYAELASANPDAGGEYAFIRKAYGKRLAILFAWARGTVIQTGAIAYVAFVFGDYANQILPLGGAGPAIWAAISVIAFTGLNISGTQPGRLTQIGFAVATVAALVAVVVAGLTAPQAAPASTALTATSHATGLAMVFVLLTYGGWNEVAYLSGEMRNPKRDLVRVAVYGTILVTLLYLAVNFAYLKVLGFAGLRANTAVGADMMRQVAGEKGAILMALVVCCAALSTLNATIFTGARVYFALGRDVPAIAALGIWNTRGSNPANAFLLQGLIALGLVFFGSLTRDGFRTMIDYTAPVFWLFLLLVAASIFILRQREPDSMRTFVVPLYPLTPILFLLICAYLLYSSLAYTGYGALFGIAVVALGIPLAFGKQRESVTPEPEPSFSSVEKEQSK